MNHVVPVARLVVWCSYTRVMFLFYNQYLITEDIPPLLSSLLLGACSLCVAPPGRVITRLLLCYCISGVQSFLLSLPPFSYHPMAHVLVALVSEILHDVSVWGRKRGSRTRSFLVRPGFRRSAEVSQAPRLYLYVVMYRTRAVLLHCVCGRAV